MQSWAEGLRNDLWGRGVGKDSVEKQLIGAEPERGSREGSTFLCCSHFRRHSLLPWDNQAPRDGTFSSFLLQLFSLPRFQDV